MDVIGFVDAIESYAELRGGEGGTGGGLSLVVFESTLFPVGWLYRTLYALVSPLPVEFSSIDKAWQSIGTIVHLLFLPFWWLGILRAARDPGWRHVLVAFVALFIGMAMFTFTFRHITQYLPFAVLLTALGYENYRGRHTNVLFGMAGLGGVLGVMYLALKVGG